MSTEPNKIGKINKIFGQFDGIYFISVFSYDKIEMRELAKKHGFTVEVHESPSEESRLRI